ncbi:MAG: ParA family protein [Alphaproteobacteria bacterium]|nr:ParA family protein [Alphaproteobacteria bacterium]
MTRILSIVNQKGGVGKTTTAVNLATAMAAIGKRVLLIDLDPQGNASTGLGFGQHDREHNSYDLLAGDASVAESARPTQVPNLHLIPTTMDLAGAELELVNAERRNTRLKDALNESLVSYDFVLIDCPPSLGLLTLNSLVASNAVLIPLQCEFYALEGLSHLLKTVEMVRDAMNPELEVQGIVLTMYDRRNKLTEQIETDVRGFLGAQVYQTTIPRNVRISEAPSHGKPALIYDINCPGSLAYAKLAAEVLTRENRLAQNVA